MFEQRLALLEGTKYHNNTVSGMDIIFSATSSQAKTGVRIFALRALFGSSNYILTEQLPKYAVETVLVDGTN